MCSANMWMVAQLLVDQVLERLWVRGADFEQEAPSADQMVDLLETGQLNQIRFSRVQIAAGRRVHKDVCRDGEANRKRIGRRTVAFDVAAPRQQLAPP